MLANKSVTVIDFGRGNLASVSRGFESVGAQVVVTDDLEIILRADRVVLPGVGAFPDAMAELATRDLISVIQSITQRGVPFMGICLGMQLLFERGFEFCETSGLSLLGGDVVRFPNVCPVSGHPLKLPNVGWRPLYPIFDEKSWDSGILKGIPSGESVYFVHSYIALPSQANFEIATTKYGGVEFVGVVAKDNIVGCQFHPEKSGEVGLRILKNFIDEF